LSLLFDLIRRNGEIDRHHLHIVCELAERPARTRAALEDENPASAAAHEQQLLTRLPPMKP